jgi:hypothetical protein
MALYINDAEVDAMVAQLAESDKTTKVEAVRRALREEIGRRQRGSSRQERMSGLNELAERASSLMKEAGTYKPYTKVEANEMFSYLDDEAERLGH